MRIVLDTNVLFSGIFSEEYQGVSWKPGAMSGFDSLSHPKYLKNIRGLLPGLPKTIQVWI